MLSTSGGERRNAFAALERTMLSDGVTWTDLGDVVANGGELDGKYTEAEMLEFAQAARAEGVETGIRIGAARTGNGSGKSNGDDHLTLPSPADMAEYCHGRSGKLKDTKQRDFIDDMLRLTQRGTRLSSARYSYLVGIYIKISGKTG
jgi:hypothetical protein